MQNHTDTPKDPSAIAMQLYSALADDDHAAALSNFAPDAVWIQPGDSPVSGEHRGHEALAQTIMPLVERGLRIDPINYWPAEPDRVVVLSRVTLGGESADEIDILTVRNEQIVHLQHIGDTQMLERAFKEKS